LNTTGEYGELFLVPGRREELEEASTRESGLGFMRYKLATPNLPVFNPPFHLIGSI
jgi:hypothetical protein